MSQRFILKNVKLKMTRNLNYLANLIAEANEYREWEFPNTVSELELFLLSNRQRLQNLISTIRERKEYISEYYNDCNSTIADSSAQDEQVKLEQEFDNYWIEKKGEALLQEAEHVERQLEKRLVELECQETLLREEVAKKARQETSTTHQWTPSSTEYQTQIGPQPTAPSAGYTLERRLLGNEPKIPQFNGKPSEFGPFWELFEELVHKQPYSNIEKLSILLNSCTGDAARALQMIPRTGDSYDRAITQLKTQFEDPKQITLQMIRQLKSMKQCREDPRSLRNNLSDVHTVIATLEKQGEVVNTTYMQSMVLETFPRTIQDEMAKKEFDSEKTWTMTELLDNLTLAVKRKEHIASLQNTSSNDYSVFHTHTRTAQMMRCIGCGQPHKFEYCNTYTTIPQKIERLKVLRACWKCFKQNHSTQFCRRRNCIHCNGNHHPIICKRQHNTGMRNRQRDTTYARSRSSSPPAAFMQRRLPLNHTFLQRRPLNPTRNEPRPPRPYSRSPPRYRHRRNSIRSHSRSPSRSPGTQYRVRFASDSPTQHRPLQHARVNFQIQDSEYENSHHEHNTSVTNRGEVRLMVVPVQLQSGMNTEKRSLFALLDSASDQSFILNSLARQMNLPIQSETTIVVNTFGGRAEKKRVRRVVGQLFNTKGEYITIEFLTSDKITPPLQFPNISSQDELFICETFSNSEICKGSKIATGTVTPGILIGMDHFNSIMNLNQPTIRLPSGLFITSTFFGPVISGTHHDDYRSSEQTPFYEHIVQMCTAQDDCDSSNFDITDLWRLPGIGIEESYTEEELNQQIINEFYSTVQNRNGEIYVRFPWKPNKDSLASNYNLALSRLHQLFKMKSRNPACWEEYCNIIDSQYKKHFIEDAPLNRDANSSTPCYYIPHQAVIKTESTTTKTRIVLDASSKMKGELSLNDVIHQGPLILPNLCGILMRSRIGSKVMIADVEKAFHMIHLQETERDAVRFLWLHDVGKPPTPDNIRILRFCRLPFGINASPFLLGISIKYGIAQQSNVDGTLQKQLNDNLYVDNVLLTAVSSQDLLEKYKSCKQIFNNLRMNLRQFLTNDIACNAAIAPEDLSSSKSVKILGIPWNHNSDSLSIQCKLRYTPNPTKRKVLQATHSTFDPLGFLTPLLMPAKVFLQSLWKLKVNWDEPLTSDLAGEWEAICKNAAGYIASTPRTVTINSIHNQYELHAFVDASSRSFAASVYLRTINKDNTISSSLLMGRHRLAPINSKSKTMTIPRLELLALVIGVRLTKFVLKEIHLPIRKIRIFSDSQVVLNWVQSNSKHGTFINNRCNEIRNKIQDCTEQGIICHLHYIPSEYNPADCATKGLTREQMPGHMWWSGPTFLILPEVQWPRIHEYTWRPTQNPCEEAEGSTVLTTYTKDKDNSLQTAPVIFPKDFSSLNKHKRVLALALKFLKHRVYNNISKGNQSRIQKAIPEMALFDDSAPLSTLKAVDLCATERIIIKIMQRSFSQQDFKRLDNLKLYKDDNGLIRCQGRIQTPHLSKETLEPILLPTHHKCTALFVKEAHLRSGHQGVNGTLAYLRLNYWIPKGRQIVKRHLRTCFVCKKWNARPYFYPLSPPLPNTRTSPSRPFSHIGIDLAGPLRITTTHPEKTEHKKWVFLATCMATRAVHLEVLNSLSTIDFINVLRRCIARRGKPQLIISDNASNFALGQEIIQTLEVQNQIPNSNIQTFLANEHIQWKFITPLSPWKGGFYERMIGVMKSILRRVQKTKLLNESEFQTHIAECEAMINTRPLTYIGSTVDDSAILRPIDFLIPYANVNFLPSSSADLDDEDYIPILSTRESVLQHFQIQIGHLEHLWKYWIDNYLLELRNFHQKRIKQKSFTRKVPLLGEVVLLQEENTPRGEWPIGLVTKLIKDSDGTIRSVELKTAKSQLTRSINMLIPLEIESDVHNTNEKQENAAARITNKETTFPLESNEPVNSNANDAMAAEPTTDDSSTTPTHSEQRARPYLPRRAKQNKAYAVNATLKNNAHHERDRASATWYRWLLVTIIVSLCRGAYAHREKTEDVIHCVTGGVEIRMPQIQDKVQICADNYCLEFEQPDNQFKVQFPAEITLHTYRVLVKSQQGNLTQALHWACPPSAFCEQISCTFCTPMITNPECWPRIAIALSALILYMLLLTIYLAFQIIRKVYRGFSCCCAITRHSKNLLYRIFRRLHTRRDSSGYIQMTELQNTTSNKWRIGTITRIVTTISLCMTLVEGCQQTVVISSSNSICSSKNDTCGNSTVVIAKFNTMQSELCLRLHDGDQQTHLMKISIQELVLRCQKETLYFTRTTETKVLYSKRCPLMGSCKGLKCSNISPDTMIEELAPANNFTGITYCSESCGGLGCSCGLPSSGCLFYRIYHVPKDNDIYEVFQCPSWRETVKFKIEDTHEDKTFTGEIKPYTIQRVGKAELEITQLSFSPIPLLNKRFLTNYKTTSYLPDETTFTYVCTTHPRYDNASQTCLIHDSCKCNPAQDAVNCYCTHNEVPQFQQLSNLLPLPILNGLAVPGVKKMPRIHTTAIAAELAIHLPPTTTRIRQDITEFQCKVILKLLTGCYNCAKGAIATIWCSTNVKQSIAQITCDTQEFVVTCTHQGNTNHVQLFFHSARVEELCKIQCSKHITVIKMQGTLNYINGIKPFLKYLQLFTNSTQQSSSFNIDFKWPDITHFMEVCKTFYIYTMGIVLIFSCAILISATHLCKANHNMSRRQAFSSTIFLLFAASMPLLLVKAFLKILSKTFKFILRTCFHTSKSLLTCNKSLNHDM